MKCPKCGKKAKMLITQYGKRYYCCDVWAWGKYLMVDKETHDLRKKAHSLFDPIWQLHDVSRADMYKKLAQTLGIPKKDCHFKLMNKTMLHKVLIAIDKILKEEI